jgi:AraC family transcriptional regulator
MRSEYAQIRPYRRAVTTTRARQIGVSFSRHSGLVREIAGTAVRADVAPGAVFVTGNEPITWTDVSEPTEALEIYLDEALLRGADVATSVDARDGLVVSIAHRLRRAHRAGDALGDVEASTIAHRLAAHMVGEYGGRPVPAPPARTLDRRVVDRVLEYVDAHVGETITLDALARVAALSPFHFGRAFRTTTGLTPHQFVTARRIEVARARLVTTTASVVDVAHAVGFSNLSHFRRVFRRELGVLPRELRQQDRTLPA